MKARRFLKSRAASASIKITAPRGAKGYWRGEDFQTTQAAIEERGVHRRATLHQCRVTFFFSSVSIAERSGLPRRRASYSRTTSTPSLASP